MRVTVPCAYRFKLAGEWRLALGTLAMALLSILECGLKMSTVYLASRS